MSTPASAAAALISFRIFLQDAALQEPLAEPVVLVAAGRRGRQPQFGLVGVGECDCGPQPVPVLLVGEVVLGCRVAREDPGCYLEGQYACRGVLALAPAPVPGLSVDVRFQFRAELQERPQAHHELQQVEVRHVQRRAGDLPAARFVHLFWRAAFVALCLLSALPTRPLVCLRLAPARAQRPAAAAMHVGVLDRTEVGEQDGPSTGHDASPPVVAERVRGGVERHRPQEPGRRLYPFGFEHPAGGGEADGPGAHPVQPGNPRVFQDLP